jgi:hypothetical protein
VRKARGLTLQFTLNQDNVNRSIPKLSARGFSLLSSKAFTPAHRADGFDDLGFAPQSPFQAFEESETVWVLHNYADASDQLSSSELNCSARVNRSSPASSGVTGGGCISSVRGPFFFTSVTQSRVASNWSMK